MNVNLVKDCSEIKSSEHNTGKNVQYGMLSCFQAPKHDLRTISGVKAFLISLV